MPDKSVRAYVCSFPSKRDAEHADRQHRVTKRGIRNAGLPPGLDHTRTVGLQQGVTIPYAHPDKVKVTDARDYLGSLDLAGYAKL